MYLWRSRRRAFTFLEIMFVVVIIGILLAISVPRLTGKSKRAKIKATQSQIRNIGVSLSEFELHAGRFPDSSEGLEALLERPSNIEEDVWEGPYLEKKEVPKDAWGKPLNYRAPGEHNSDYDLWSNGPDNQEGTDDDVHNW
ncbi:type II secretion system major pseudopilin GspG [Candidatus Poribacteria bacterium]|nr:type II secretion system major pseudopilin GspG [Candidatus Poribacteria bacterium]